MHVWITSTLLTSALYCSNSSGNTLLTIVRCLPHARSCLGHVTHPFVEFSKPPELNTGVSVRLTVHLGWSPPGFVTDQYKADLAGGCWLLTADRVCPLPWQQTYETGTFYSPHCIDEETEAQSNSLNWQKITQLLIANVDSQCPTSATPWHPLMDAEFILQRNSSGHTKLITRYLLTLSMYFYFTKIKRKKSL